MGRALTLLGKAVHLVAAMCLLFAATIHSFPAMLARWDVFIAAHPDAHLEIGLFGFVVALLNLGFLFAGESIARPRE